MHRSEQKQIKIIKKLRSNNCLNKIIVNFGSKIEHYKQINTYKDNEES